MLPWRRRRRKRAHVVVGHGRKSPPVRSLPPMLVSCLLELHPILLHFLRSNNHNNNRFNPSPNFVNSSVCLSGCLMHDPCHDQVLESGCMVSAIESRVFVCSCGAWYLHTLQPSPNGLHSILSVSVSVCLSVCLSHSGDDI